jgi:hypothetical protein
MLETDYYSEEIHGPHQYFELGDFEPTGHAGVGVRRDAAASARAPARARRRQPAAEPLHLGVT